MKLIIIFRIVRLKVVYHVLPSVQEATVIEFNPVTNMVVLQASVDDSRKCILENC